MTDPNEKLECVRNKISSLQGIRDSVAGILSLLDLSISMMKEDIKDLEKRACPKCGVIHSTRMHPT